MTVVAAIVEGDGEVRALPVLLRRLCAWLSPGLFVEIATPIRVKRDRFINRRDELEKYVRLAAAKCGADGWILILLDADDDCPAKLGSAISMRASMAAPDRNVSVVFANREFEAWFIAAAPSLDGHRGFAIGKDPMPDPETPRDAKGWIKSRMASHGYGETTDQPAFTARMDLPLARDNSRSFRKLCDEWARKMARDPR